MRRFFPGLLAILGASLLLNAVLLAKRPGAPAPAPAHRKPAVDASAAALAVERERSAALERRVEALEVEKTILAQGSGAPPSRAERLDALRERIRRYLRYSTDPRAQAFGLTPEGQVELNDTYGEFFRLKVERVKDPGLYLEALRMFFVIGLEEAKAPLDPRQTEDLARVLDGIGAGLRGLEAFPPLERLPKEIEAATGIQTRILAVLTPEQGGKLENAMSGASLWDSVNGHWVEREHAESSIVEAWTQSYGLEDAQKPAALAAARAYIAALDRLNASYRDGDPTLYGPEAEAADHRLRAARALIAALESLQGSLTPEQARRLRGLSPREIRFMMKSEILGAEDPK